MGYERNPHDYERYLKAVGLALQSRLARPVDIDDVIQTTFAKAVGTSGANAGFHGGTDAEYRGWLRRIFINTLWDRLRKADVLLDARSVERLVEESSRSVCEQLAASITSPSQAALKAEEVELLYQALTELPEHHRKVIELHNLQCRSLDEVAKELGISRDAVASRLRRGIAELKRRMLGSEDSPQ